MKHAYNTNLNKKKMSVLYYKYEDDNKNPTFIAEYESVAEASRQTKIPEHVIRDIAKGKRTSNVYLWKYKDEEKSKLYSEKFSSKPNVK